MLKPHVSRCWFLVSLVAFLLSGCRGSAAISTVAATPAAATVTAAGTSVVVPETIAPTAIISTQASTATPPRKASQSGKIDLVNIPAPALAENVFGDPTQQKIAVYLPPSYEGSNRKYPVVYYLVGSGTRVDAPTAYPYTQAAMNHLLAQGKTREVIVVTAAGFNALGASFYLNSPLTGNWEDFIARDVTNYVDTHYRTLATSASRGISGHSMGGFGAINLAMHHPEVFGALYSLSPALFDPNGLSDSLMFASPQVINQVLDLMEAVSNLPPDQAKKEFLKQYARADSAVQFTLAYGTAISPAPDGAPPYIVYPYHREGKQLVRDEALWKQWESGFGGISDKVQQFKSNLEALKGIVIDYGEQDQNAWIPPGCQYLSQQLTAAGIENTLLAFQGDHFNQLGVRIEEHMAPFFSQELVFEEQ